MINNIADILKNSNTMVATVSIAALGYVLNLLKFIPLRIMSMVMQKLTKTVYCDNTMGIRFRAIERKVYDDYQCIFRNHVSAQDISIDGLPSSSYSIAPGRYTKVLWKQLTLIEIRKFRNDRGEANDDSQGRLAMFELSISCIGLRSNTIIEEFRQLISTTNDDNMFDRHRYVRILKAHPVFFSTAIIGYTSKKKREAIFDDSTLTAIDRHLDRFIANKNIYDYIGDTYKTGILLHGKPGTGKSTIAKYIASRLDAIIIQYPQQHEFMKTIYKYTANNFCIVLIEEIEKVIRFKDAMEDENDYQRKMSSAALLQLMDGIQTPANVIFVATSNDISRLPEALLRKGRFDLTIEMNGIARSDAENMCRAFKSDISVLDEIETDENNLYNPSELRYMLLDNMYK